MKKTYIAPEMEITEMESQVLMFSSSLNDDEVNTDTDQQAGDRRGTWGNLWN